MLLPSSYLGLPLGAKHNSVTEWDGVEKIFLQKISPLEKAIHL